MSGFCLRFGFRDPGAIGAMAQRLRHRGARSVSVRRAGLEAEILGRDADAFVAVQGSSSIFGDATVFAQGSVTCSGQSRADAARRVLEAWLSRGEVAIRETNGDFVFAIHDESRERLVIARDRAGARPLYYAKAADGWVFASEYKSVLAALGRTPAVDREVLAELQARKSVPRGRSLLEGIHALPSGTLLTLDRAGEPQLEPFWQPALDLQDWLYERQCTELRETFLRAVARRLEHGRGTTISLSGGIDSIAIVAAARHVSPDARLLTYSAGDALDDPELLWAERVAKMFGAEHRSIVADPTRLAHDLPRLVWHLEDPIARTEVWQAQQLCEVVAPVSETMLRGDGSDGMFGGMDRHQLLAWAAATPPLRSALEDVYWFTQAGTPPKSWIARLGIDLVLARKIPRVPRVLGSSGPAIHAALPGRGKELLNEVMVQGPTHSLPLLLRKVERMFAAHAMTTSSPFVDPEMIAAAFRIPSRFKHDGVHNKKVLRDAMRPLLPAELANRPKYAQRVRETRPFCEALAAIAGRLLSPEQVRARSFFVPEDVALLLPRRADGTWAPEHAMRIWTLVLTELWARAFVDGDGSQPPSID
jgi:asparagine synthase (glutamine-hydrolysing)